MKNSLYKTDIVWVIIAKSDEIGKIAHLAFSLEICGGWHIGKTLFNHCCHLEFSPISSLLAMLVTIPVLFPVLKESPRGRLKGVFRTGIVMSVAKSDEIGKIAHLAFSLEICGGWHIGKTLFSNARNDSCSENSL